MAKKTDRVLVCLECSEARELKKTPSRYMTQKNKKNTTGKMALKKYNPYLRRVTLHKEVKA